MLLLHKPLLYDMFNLSKSPPAVFFSLQPPCVFHNTVLSSVAEQGDDVAVLNGCQEEHKTSSAKVQHAHTSNDSIGALVKHSIKHLSLKLLDSHAPCLSLFVSFLLFHLRRLSSDSGPSVVVIAFISSTHHSLSQVTAPGQSTACWVHRWRNQCGPVRVLYVTRELAPVSAWLGARGQQVQAWITLPWYSCVPRTTDRRATPISWML